MQPFTFGQPQPSTGTAFGGFGQQTGGIFSPKPAATTAGQSFFGAPPPAPAPSPALSPFGTPGTNPFGKPQMASTPLFGTTSTSQAGTQQQSTATPAFGTTGGLFGTTATPQTQANTLFGSSQPATSTTFGTQPAPSIFGAAVPPATQAQPGTLFGVAAQPQQQSLFNFGGSTAPFGQQQAKPSAFNFGQPQPQTQQQQQPQMILDDQVALHQSILNCSKFGDERDAILANLNFIQASWGSGQGYFSPNHPPVLYSDKNIFYRFKSVGYSFMYSDSNEEGQVVMSLKRPQLQPGSPDETSFLSALQNLVARPNILFRICGSKKFLENDEMSMIILVADDRNTLRRVLATDLAEALCQPMLKPQLEKLGVLDVSAKVKPGGEQLKAYLETPPPGMDVRVWKKAQEDNPDPENMIPFPLIGAEALKKRLDAQKKESAQHQQRLKVIGEEVASLANRHVNMNAELQQMRRRFTTLSHRILSAILRLLMIQMKDLPVQPEEENLRRQLASFQKEFNTAQDFRGRLNLLMEIVNLQRNENNTGGSGGETKSGLLDAAAFEQVKQLLKLQHECLKHLVGTVKSDLEVVNKMGETVSHFNGVGVWK